MNTGKSLNRVNRDAVNSFNANPSRSEYTRLLDLNPLYSDRAKCSVCGGDIYYGNIMLKGAYDEYVSIYSGTTHLSTKVIDGNEYHIHVCEECMKRKFPELCDSNISRIYNRPTKYAEYAFSIPHDLIEAKKSELCVRSIDTYISRYGEEDGRKRWDAYVERQRYTNTFEYKNAVHGMTKDEFDAYNKSRAVTLDNMIKRYGEEEGRKRWDDYRYREAYTNSMKYYICKYGYDGIRKWHEVYDKKRVNGYSAISQELFNRICADKFFEHHEIYYATVNGEYEVVTNENVYYLDFYDKTLNLCIEFNGTKYHPKDRDYKDDDMFCNPFMKTPVSVKSVRDYERKRTSYLEDELGMHVIVIWDDDYIKDKDLCIKSIIDKIKMLYE